MTTKELKELEYTGTDAYVELALDLPLRAFGYREIDIVMNCVVAERATDYPADMVVFRYWKDNSIGEHCDLAYEGRGYDKPTFIG